MFNRHLQVDFDVLLDPRLFFFVSIRATDIYATNETRASCATNDHVECSVLRSVETKSVRIKNLFFVQVRFLLVISQLHVHVSHCAYNKFIED